ncbi:DUF899 family protein [Bacillus alkalisoli]|nr:DUF899 family protein [Bacillus alkalisoli]
MDHLSIDEQIEQLQLDIIDKKQQLAALRKQQIPTLVKNYQFIGSHEHKVSLSQLFQDKNELFVVHNMGKSCPYCTMWADGFNSVYPHIIEKAAFVLSSPDSPFVQEDFSSERGWQFPIISTKGTTFKEDMGFEKDNHYYPGVSVFTKDEQGNIYQHTKAPFGPGDDFCVVWSLFDLLPSGYETYKPLKKLNPASPFQLTNNVAVQVDHYDDAINFYKNTIGMTLENSGSNESKLSISGTNFFIEKQTDPSSKHVFFEFAVANFDEVKDELLFHGCKITKEYNETSVMIKDPYGLNFHLYESK